MLFNRIRKISLISLVAVFVLALSAAPNSFAKQSGVLYGLPKGEISYTKGVYYEILAKFPEKPNSMADVESAKQWAYLHISSRDFNQKIVDSLLEREVDDLSLKISGPVSSKQIELISQLWDYLINLDLSGTGVSDISNLKNMKWLEVLSLENTKVSDITVLDSMPALEWINIRGTGVSKEGVEVVISKNVDLEVAQ